LFIMLDEVLAADCGGTGRQAVRFELSRLIAFTFQQSPAYELAFDLFLQRFQLFGQGLESAPLRPPDQATAPASPAAPASPPADAAEAHTLERMRQRLIEELTTADAGTVDFVSWLLESRRRPSRESDFTSSQQKRLAIFEATLLDDQPDPLRLDLIYRCLSAEPAALRRAAAVIYNAARLGDPSGQLDDVGELLAELLDHPATPLEIRADLAHRLTAWLSQARPEADLAAQVRENWPGIAEMLWARSEQQNSPRKEGSEDEAQG
jgi:hypothetical protein